MRETYRVVNEGMGGFLNPPGDAEHSYSVSDGYGKNAGFMALRYALDKPYVPESCKAAIRTVLASNPPQITEEWTRKVYGYFRHCYSPDGVNRSANDYVILKTGGNPEWSLAVLHIRQWDAEHVVRMDLL